MILVDLAPLGRKPHGCPPEAQRSWARYVATQESVNGLFNTLRQLRK